MISIDEQDAQILNALQKDGRITVKELSEMIGLSPTPIFERIKKMERSGLIDHYAAMLNNDQLGKKLYAFAHISLKDHTKELVEEFTQQIIQFDEVLECHYVTGDSDFILKILLKDMEKYREFVMNSLFNMRNIAKVETYLSLSVSKLTHAIKVEHETN